MTDPWAKVATALGHDEPTEPDPSDEAEAGTTTAGPQAAWGQVAKGLGRAGVAAGTPPPPQAKPAKPAKPDGGKGTAASVKARDKSNGAKTGGAKPDGTKSTDDRARPESPPPSAGKDRPASRDRSASRDRPASRDRSVGKDRPTARDGATKDGDTGARPKNARAATGGAGTVNEPESDLARTIPRRSGPAKSASAEAVTRRPAETDDGEGDGGDGSGSGPLAVLRAGGRRLAALIGAVVAVVVIIVVVLVVVLGGGGLPSGAAMKVGSRTVPVTELNTNIAVLAKFYGITQPAASDKAATATFQKTAAKAYAIDLLLQNAAPRYQVAITPAQVTTEFNQLVTSVANGKSTTLDQLLTADNLTETDLRNQIRQQLLEVALYKKVVGTPTVSDAQVQAAYQANMSQLATPETRAVSHIVVADQATATNIIAQVNGGASFATLASQQSLDTNTKANGGALGTVAASQLSSAFSQQAFAAPLNQPFGPVDEGTNSGWDVGLVTAINPGAPATNNAATLAIVKTYLVDQAENTRWKAWLSGLLTKGKVTYAAKYKPVDPDAAPTTTTPTLPQLVLQSIENPSASSTSSTGSTP